MAVELNSWKTESAQFLLYIHLVSFDKLPCMCNSKPSVYLI